MKKYAIQPLASRVSSWAPTRQNSEFARHTFSAWAITKSAGKASAAFTSSSIAYSRDSAPVRVVLLISLRAATGPSPTAGVLSAR